MRFTSLLSPLREFRRFFIGLFVITISLLQFQYSFGQTILKLHGRVFNADGPCAGAMVFIDNTSFQTTADNAGHYAFYDIPSGAYRLSCRHGNLQLLLPERLDLADGPAVQRDIYLERNVVNVAPIVVEVTRDSPQPTGSGPIVVDINRSGKELSEIIRGLPGLNMVASADGGEVFIAAAGSRPEAIDIFIDGRKINSLLTGRADLSQVPLGAVRRVEYYPSYSNDAKTTPGLTGTLNFITGKRSSEEELSIETQKGSFGKERYAVNATHFARSIGIFQAGGENKFHRNNYPYPDYFGVRQIRQNAQQKSRKYFLSYANSPKAYLIKISGFGFTGNNGLPGKIISPSPYANADRQTISLGGILSHQISTQTSWSGTFSYLNRHTYYHDEIEAIAYTTRYYEDEKSIGLSIKANLFKIAKSEFGLTYTSSTLDGRDDLRPQYALGSVRRDVNHLGGALQYDRQFSDISMIFGISGGWDILSTGRYPSFSATTTLLYKRGIAVGVNLVEAGTFRLPGLAELNWKEDVFALANPDLRPERSRQTTAELFSEYQRFGHWRASVEYRDIRYKDLIYWRRSQGLKYKPVNVSSSDYFGTTMVISYDSPDNIFNLKFSRVKSTALNREQGQPYFGKYIIFQPLYINQFEFGLSFLGLAARVNVQDVSRRYYLEENTKWLHPYTLVNVSLMYALKVKRLKTDIELRVENASDAHYELLEYQPMPPRAYCLGLTMGI